MSIRTRIFLVCTFLFVTGFGLFVNWFYGEIHPRYMEALEESLGDTSIILAEVIGEELDTHRQLDKPRWSAIFERVTTRVFENKIYDFSKTNVDTRVYVTDKNGVVIFDSDSGRDEGDDYSQWRDVYLTLKGGYGARSTRGDPLHVNGSVKYIAAPIFDDGTLIGVVSVGKSAKNINTLIKAAKENFIVAASFVALIIIILLSVLYYWMTRPLKDLVAYARQVSLGKTPHLPDLGNNEIGLVGREMENMRSALDGKAYIEQYIQMLTHELKSPLSAIKGASELLEEEMSDQDRQRFLTSIHSETDRMQDFIERLLQLASVEKQIQLTEFARFNVNELLQDIIFSLSAIAVTKEVDIKCNSLQPHEAEGDKFLLRLAITNLLKNAIDFSPNRSTINVTLESKGNELTISISDHGPGIPQYARTRIFERFYSLPHTNRKTKGTGLGLTLAKEIADLHNAKITIDNYSGGVVAKFMLRKI